MPRHRIRAHYEQLSEFERGHIILLKEASWNLTDWGRIGFSDKSCFQLYPDNQRRHVWRHPRQSADPAFPIARHTGINEKLCLSKSSLGIHITKSFSIEHVWDMMGRRLHLLGNVDDLPRQLEQTLQEIPQKTVRVIYHSMARRVAACI
ncbi:hypothetical protein TNCV_4465531 [Trichonephila clavipes]|nr:hypothetical protein TNCV_4465531 [Trichonephila clavipes]